MIYSVWRPNYQVYEYYRDSLGVSADDGPNPKLKSKDRLGATPGDVSWKIPKNVVKIGNGPEAKGVVVHPTATGDILDSRFPIVGLLLVAYGLYKFYAR